MDDRGSGALERERKTIRAMVEIYCADHHASPGGLCPECRQVLAYSEDRLDRCPYGDEKPTCQTCPVHCYRPEQRDAVRVVMRYAGPRMFWRHPWLAAVHLWKQRVRRAPDRWPRRGADGRPPRI